MIELGHFPVGAALSDTFPFIVSVVTTQAKIGVYTFTYLLIGSEEKMDPIEKTEHLDHQKQAFYLAQ